MANPHVVDGHIRIANDLWLEWTKTGPLIERVRKAIIWECWGYKDRRENKQPVPITRGRIATLTGIVDKTLISRLTAKLVQANIVIRYSDGRLETARYWPDQDYESWKYITSVETDTSDQSVPITSDQSVTPTIQAGTNRASSMLNALARSQSLYCENVLNGNKNLNWRERNRFKVMFAELPDLLGCSEDGIYNAIHDWFCGCLPGHEPRSDITPYARWLQRSEGERLGVALLRIKIEDAIKTKILWSERMVA